MASSSANSTYSFFSLPWRKGSSTQSEYGSNETPLRRTPNGVQTTSSWAAQARQDLFAQRHPLQARFLNSTAPSDILASPYNSSQKGYRKTYSTISTISTSRVEPTQSRSLVLGSHAATPSSVQETLLASLFQKQHKSSRRRTRQLQYKLSAATECDPADFQTRDTFKDPFPSVEQTKVTSPKRHAYAQSEYGGAYGANQQRNAFAKLNSTEVDDGLNEWGLPKILVANRYDDEPEPEEDGEEYGSDFGSDSDDSFMKPTESVTFQQIIKEYSKPKPKPNYASSNATMVDHGLPPKPTRPKQTTRTIKHKKEHISLRALDKLITLLYILCIVCPPARYRSSYYLAVFLDNPSERSTILARAMAISWYIAKRKNKPTKRRSARGIPATSTSATPPNKPGKTSATPPKKPATKSRTRTSELKPLKQFAAGGQREPSASTVRLSQVAPVPMHPPEPSSKASMQSDAPSSKPPPKGGVPEMKRTLRHQARSSSISESFASWGF